MGRLYNVTPPCPYCGEEQSVGRLDSQIENKKYWI